VFAECDDEPGRGKPGDGHDGRVPLSKREREEDDRDPTRRDGHPDGRRNRQFLKDDPLADVADRREDDTRERMVRGSTRRGPTEQRGRRTAEAGVDVRDADGAGRHDHPEDLYRRHPRLHREEFDRQDEHRDEFVDRGEYETSPRLNARRNARNARNAAATVGTVTASTPPPATPDSATVGTVVGSTVGTDSGRYRTTAAALTPSDDEAGPSPSKYRFTPYMSPPRTNAARTAYPISASRVDAANSTSAGVAAPS
jgi:hypothetical protein